MPWNYAADPFYRALLADIADTEWQIVESEFLTMNLESANRAFLMRRSVTGVRFHHNDFVMIVAGKFVGERGSIISIETLAEDLCLLIELESGGDATIPQSLLKIAAG